MASAAVPSFTRSPIHPFISLNGQCMNRAFSREVLAAKQSQRDQWLALSHVQLGISEAFERGRFAARADQ